MALQLLLRSSIASGSASSVSATAGLRQAACVLQAGCRNMAVYVEVEDNRVQKALGELNRKREEAGLADELRKRKYHMNGAARRFEQEKKSYKTAVGQVVKERIKWVMQRRRGNLLE